MLPSKVKIGGVIVPISYLDLEGDASGRYHLPDNMIEVEDRLSPTRKTTVSLHEVLHALIHINNINTLMNLSIQQEEILVDHLERTLHPFIIDNPEYIRWLQHVYEDSKRKRKVQRKSR